MAAFELLDGFARCQEDQDSLRISWPFRHNWLLILFVVALLGFLLFGANLGLQQLQTTGEPLAIVWLAFWGIPTAAVAMFLAWLVFGHESIEVNSETLTVRRQIAGLGSARRYDLRRVTRLRTLTAPTMAPTASDDTGESATEWYPTIAFDHGPTTVKCGRALDEGDAWVIVDRLKERQPRLRDEGDV
jgi:hypothetical protein